MNSPSEVEPPPAPSSDLASPSGTGGSLRRATAYLSRRRLLMIAGGGFASGVLAREIITGFAPVAADGATEKLAAETSPGPGSALPMEEEPLPGDVHLPVTRTAAAPVASGVAANVSEPAEPDALVPAPPLPLASAIAQPIAPPAPLSKAAHLAPAPPAAPVKAATPPKPLAVPIGREAAWQRNARPFVNTGATPAIAIVIDDLGLSAVHTRQAIALGAAVTTAFMTYAPHLDQWTAAARAARHEMLLHVPMQPLNGKIDAGPKALTVALSDAEILDRLRWGLGRMEGYVGINNHMGSRFTQDRGGMAVVLAEVKSRGLLYLDSVTIGGTVGPATADSLHVPFAERNVFLDDEATVAGVSRQLAVLEKLARRHGSAIAIGHPHEATLTVLAQWLPRAAARGVAVVPLTSVMRRQASKA